jgi:hypothetical protein
VFGVYPANDEPTTTVRLSSPARGIATSRFGRARIRVPSRRVVATWIAVVLLAAGAVAGVRAAVAYITHDPDPDTATGADAAPSPNAPGANAPGANAARAPAGGATGTGAEPRIAWARQYGQNRAGMPNLPDVARASQQQRDAASDLLTRTQTATAPYAGTDTAQAAGYDFAAALAHAKGNPLTVRRMSRIDGGAAPLRPVVLRAVNKAFVHDGKPLDPSAPQALIYAYQGHNAWKLIGATFRADGAYPNPPPDPGGPITRWRYVDRYPAILAMDVYFVAAGDLAHAYALMPPNL